ncbi:MAG: tail fiber domain-containing protein, partial [Minisyncoccota bacterium]
GNLLDLKVASTSKFTVDASGNITASGSFTLPALAVNSLISTDASGQLVATSTITTNNIWATSTSAVNYFAGNVGIGTTTPTANLNVVRATSGAVIIARGTSSSGYNDIQIRNDLDSSVRTLSLTYTGSAYPTAYYNTGTTGEVGAVGTTGAFPLLFGTNNAQRMIITSAGNVGVGTTSPSALFTVGGAGQLAMIGDTSGVSNLSFSNNRAFFGYNSNGIDGAVIQATVGKGISFNVNNATVGNGFAMGITSTGNVGIGTSTPVAKLDVNGSIAGNFTEAGPLSALRYGGNAGDSARLYGLGVGAVGSAGQFNIISSHSGAAGTTIGSYNGTTYTPYFNVLNTGNVGIGTTSPGAKLNIVADRGAATRYPFIIGTDKPQDSVKLGYTADGVNTTLGILNAPNSPLALFSNNSEAIRIQSNGNVGIGTTTPSAKLDISGNSAGLIFTGGGTHGLGGGAGDLLSIYSVQQLTFNNGNKFIQNSPVSYAETLFTGPASNIATMTWGADGNVGIGTTSPSALLSVNAPAGQASFAIGSSTATSFIVDKNGNVGVGTITPSNKLDIYGTSGQFGIYNTGNSNRQTFSFTTNGNSARLMMYDSTPTLQTNLIAGQDSYINGTTGNLGIGTTSPSAKLSIKGAGTTTGRAFAISNSSDIENVTVLDNGNVGVGTTTPTYTLDINGSGVANQLRINGNSPAMDFTVLGSASKLTVGVSAATNGFITGSVSGDPVFRSGGGKILFSSSASGTTNDLTLKGGNVGIGTTTPGSGSGLSGAILDVNGYIMTANGKGVLGYTSLGANTTLMRISSANNSEYYSVGDTIFYNNSIEKMRILNNGNVGIGTTTPDGRLTVSSAADTHVYVEQVAGAKFDIYAGSSSAYFGTTNNFGFGLRTNGVQRVTIDTNGNVGVGTTSPWKTFSVTGTMAVSGLSAASSGDSAVCISPTGEIRVNSGTATCTVSSARFKHNIATSTISALDLVNAMRPVKYEYNNSTSGEHYGFIAEEVNLLDPRLVAVNSDGLVQSVRYEEFTSVLAKAVQEMSIKVNDLDTRLTNLEAIVASQQTGGVTFNDVLTGFENMGARFVNGIAYFKNVFVESLTIGTQEKPSGITLYDEVTGEPYCLKMRNGAMVSLAGDCINTSGSTATSTPVTDIATTTDAVAPVISLMGNNPAEIQVGTSYVDLGSTVTDMGINPLDPSGPLIQNNNLGIQYSVNGVSMSDISIDTTATSTNTIVFSAVDMAGNWGYATRTVEVIPMQ